MFFWLLNQRVKLSVFKSLHCSVKKCNNGRYFFQFCMPAPIVFSDVNYLSTTAPPSAAEWSSFLRPLRGTGYGYTLSSS